MSFPQNLELATEAVVKARRASDAFRSECSDNLAQAEYIVREAAHFARSVAEDVDANEAATRLLSAILGFEFRVTGTKAGYTEMKGYAAQTRYLDTIGA